VVILFYFKDNKTYLALITNLVVGGSNKASVWWWNPQPPEANGGF